MPKKMPFAIKETEHCSDCGAELVIRNGAHGPFYACSNYPSCCYVRPLKASSDGHIVKELKGQTCSKCGSTLVLRQGRYGMFIGCSNYPECDHTEIIDKPDDTSINCPQCKQGKLLQRKSRFGKTFHACNRYPECQFTLNNKPISGECEFCHYPLLIEKKTAQGIKLFCASKLCSKQQFIRTEK
ncbi:type I DNA topoisomerase [Xenorhabdus budapestensis]|uniref:DNA topoisomerase I n=1 Tax=Xenorhabdus budapestensis TaxID=290110 RepID=A0A2D0J4U8_XENBU|nr:type I DNA topoisomerase [Xenorhabdus budapestensis]PHM29527.1 DNA topoisomerase I [Xenorhabdus budapestensis]QTL39712.1 topoisomerase DNA-binding C4 zinc finger domain-containing protein [Xenorhabdus budapestensis]